MRWLDSFMGIVVMCGYAIAFALGVYGGALITVRHYHRADVLEAKCTEALPELNRVASSLRDSLMSVPIINQPTNEETRAIAARLVLMSARGADINNVKAVSTGPSREESGLPKFEVKGGGQ